jgi:hypothetical protein
MDRWVLVRGASAAAGHRGVNRPPAVWLARILGGVGFGMPSSRKPPACPRHVAGRVAAVCGGRRGGVCSRSPRARARGLYAGRVSVGRKPNPVRQRSPQRELGDCSAKKPPARAGGLFGKEAPSASWGTVTWPTSWLTTRLSGVVYFGIRVGHALRRLRGGRQGGVCSRSPRARARGFYAAGAEKNLASLLSWLLADGQGGLVAFALSCFVVGREQRVDGVG